MKLRDIMTKSPVCIHPEELAAVAARTMEHYNIGILPVCRENGELCGLLTDRDLVTRCLASGKNPAQTRVSEVMTSKIISAKPDMEASLAAGLMGREQIRRLPVMEQGKLCGMVSLGDLALVPEGEYDAADALSRICEGISSRK